VGTPHQPLCGEKAYQAALDAFEFRGGGHDSLLSVYRVQRHAWWEGGPWNHRPWHERHELAAELQPVFFQNGAIFIQPRGKMVENRKFYGLSPILFELSAVESTDIDTDTDYCIAKALYQRSRNVPARLAWGQ